MGKGLLPNMVNMGWGTCVCISLNLPRNEAFFFLFKNQEGGEREEGDYKKPSMGESKITHDLFLARTLPSEPLKHPQDFTRLS